MECSKDAYPDIITEEQIFLPETPRSFLAQVAATGLHCACPFYKLDCGCKESVWVEVPSRYLEPSWLFIFIHRGHKVWSKCSTSARHWSASSVWSRHHPVCCGQHWQQHCYPGWPHTFHGMGIISVMTPRKFQDLFFWQDLYPNHPLSSTGQHCQYCTRQSFLRLCQGTDSKPCSVSGTAMTTTMNLPATLLTETDCSKSDHGAGKWQALSVCSRCAPSTFKADTKEKQGPNEGCTSRWDTLPK